DLGGGGLEGGDPVGEPALGRGVVVEAFGVHEVLDRHGKAHASTDVAGIGRQPGTSRAAHGIVVGNGRGQGQGGGLVDAGGYGGDAFHDLAGDQAVARAHGVAPADLDRVDTGGRGQLVHLALVSEARLHDAEAAHGAARRVVGAGRPPVDDGILAHVRTLGVG